jgi:DNA polymerase (family 10)
VRRAIDLGVKIAVNTDAHREAEFELMPYGVATAQRGWAKAGDVVNTWRVEELLRYVAG